MLSIKTITSWADLWKQEYKNSLLLTDVREVFQMALRKLGYSVTLPIRKDRSGI